MHTFEIRDKFYLDGEPFTILSGAIHPSRVHPSDWRHSLYNLKAMGFNTVEAYFTWNTIEPEPGVFDFSGFNDIAAFIDEAAELGLWFIARPSPYICGEWEWGGLPAGSCATAPCARARATPSSSSTSPATTTSSCPSSSSARSRTAATSS